MPWLSKHRSAINREQNLNACTEDSRNNKANTVKPDKRKRIDQQLELSEDQNEPEKEKQKQPVK